MRNLGKRIRDLRIAKGLSQPQLAAKAQMSQSYLWSIEQGTEREPEVQPSAAVLQRISEALGLSIGELVGERQRPIPTHHVVPSPAPNESFPESLVDYMTLCKARGTPLEEEEIWMLAGIRYKGKAPRTAEDWDFIVQAIKRSTTQKLTE